MDKTKYSITFACYNGLNYTKSCIESMIKCGTPLDRVVVVDNNSTDGTKSYLNNLSLGGLILNSNNLGCGTAWNQGVLHQQSEWSIVMNNDVIVSPYWIENLISTAEKNNCKIASPALIEGDLDYDFDNFIKINQKNMLSTTRLGARHAVCLAIHNSVWADIGYFPAIPKLLGYEDTLFFNAVDNANIQTLMTGASWLHHFGSITQTEIKKEKGLQDNEKIGNRKNYKLLHQTWFQRKMKKIYREIQNKKWRADEMSIHKMTIHGIRKKGDFEWR